MRRAMRCVHDVSVLRACEKCTAGCEKTPEELWLERAKWLDEEAVPRALAEGCNTLDKIVAFINSGAAYHITGCLTRIDETEAALERLQASGKLGAKESAEERGRQ